MTDTKQPGSRGGAAPTTAVWRQQAITEIAAEQGVLEWLMSNCHNGSRLDAEAVRRIQEQLETADDAAHDMGLSWRQRFTSSFRGASIERTWGQIDAAGEALLRVAPAEHIIGQLPRMQRRVQRALKCDDPRRQGFERVVARYSKDPAAEKMSASDRELLLTGLHGANCEGRRKQSRVRSFRNMLLLWGVVLTIAAVGLGLLGYAKPDLALLCFQPTGQAVCPTQVKAMSDATPATGQAAVGQKPTATAEQDRLARAAATRLDVLLVELVGLIAAALGAAAALRRIHGTSTPYGVPFAVAVLKLPTGALTAALGLLLMRAEFVPGLSALDSPAQILGWAIVFGYAQQLFTRFVDQRAQTVLNTANGTEPDARHPPRALGSSTS